MKTTLLIISLVSSAVLFSSCSTSRPVYGNVEQVQQQTVPSLPDNNEGAFVRGAVEFNDSVSSGGRRFIPVYPRPY